MKEPILNIFSFLFIIISSNLFAQNEIDLIQPDALVNEFDKTGFEAQKTYFGLYQKSYSQFKLVELNGIDSTFLDSKGTSHTYQYFKDTVLPELILSGNSLNSADNIVGNKLNKSILIGDMVNFNIDGTQYLIYSKGNVIPNSNQNESPYSAINNYEVILRRKKGDNFQEQSLFKFDKITWDSWFNTYNPRVTFEWIGDLNHDQEIDLVVVLSSHHECWTIIYFQSTPAGDGNLVIEVFKKDVCA